MKFSLPNKPSKEIFQFSSKQNVIHVILDEFQSTIFQEIIDEDIDRYYTDLQGFTFFKETTGSFPTTIMSIPAFLSGRIYNNDVPIDDFIDVSYKGRTISNVLAAHGYKVDFAVPLGWYCRGEHSNCYGITVPYGLSRQQRDQTNAAIMFNLVLFRYAPHFLKKAVYDNQVTLPTINLKTGSEHWSGVRNLAHKDFLQDLIDNMSVKRTKPVYKFVHLTTTHWPAILNQDCEYAGKKLPWTWENIRIQTKCSFDHFLEFLNKLKSIGIYESSFIILHADHGYWKIPDSAKQIDLKNEENQLDGYFTDDKEYFAKIVSSALPLLAIKPPYSKGPLVISEVEATLTDIPATISSVLKLDEKFNGRSVFKIGRDEGQKRTFRYYDKLNRAGDDYFTRMDEFVIKGNALDRASWSFIRHILPAQTYQTSKIDFGTNRGRRFLRAGWSSNNESSKEGLTFQWALGRSASVFISLHKNERVRLTSKVKTFLKDQQITIKVDGKKVGTWRLSSNWNWEKHSIIIATDENTPDVSVVEFTFSEVKKPEGKDPRPLAVLFESITLNRVRDDSKLLVTEVNLLSLNSDNSEGFDNLEGPYPQWKMPRQVRWMISPEAKVKFITGSEQDKAYSLNIRIRSMHPSQHFKVFLNEELLLEKRFSESSDWISLSSSHVQFQKGENILKITSSSFIDPGKINKRKLYILFDKLVFHKGS